MLSAKRALLAFFGKQGVLVIDNRGADGRANCVVLFMGATQEYEMEERLDTEKLNKAPLFSSCFMGLGQILCLKQYVRGALFALVEIVFILAILVGSKKIIPTNKAEDEYLKGTPDTATMYEYLGEVGYKSLDKIKEQRAAALKSFFTKKGPKAAGNIAYTDAMDGSDDIKDDKEQYAQMVSDAKEAQKTAIEDATRAFNEDYDWTSLDDVESASGEIAADEKAYDEYLKIVEKYDRMLAKPMAKHEAQKFKSHKAERMPVYKASLAKAKDDLKASNTTTNNKFKDEMAKLKTTYKTDLKYLSTRLDKEYKEQLAQNEVYRTYQKTQLDEVDAKIEEMRAEIEAKIDEAKAPESTLTDEERDDILADCTDELAGLDAKREALIVQHNADVEKKCDDQLAFLIARYETNRKALESDERRKRSNQYNQDCDAAQIAWDDELDQNRFRYEDKLKAAFAELGGDNQFDEHYDGCGLCNSAANAGRRTVRHRAWGQGPLVTSFAGLISLGDRQNTTEANYKDHSIFKMINGLIALIMVGFFVFLYILNIMTTKRAIKKIIWNGRFPTFKEAQGDISQNSFATIGIAPSVVMIAIFSLIPLLFSALVAFTNYSSPDHIPPNNLVDWVGLQNFVTMFSTNVGNGEWAQAFVQTAIWTLVWAVFATFSCFFVGFFYAFVLQDKRIVIPSFFRTVYILPYAIPTMLSLFVWANLLNGTIGPINHTLKVIGLIKDPIPFLSNPWVAKGSLIFVNIWIGFPYSMILTTSSMTAISASLYEAAVIDGATKWQQFKSITYPLVMFQLKPTLIMQFASNINNFGAVFFLTGGGPNMPQAGLTVATNCGATDLLISWIYKLTMNTPQRYHLASVLSLLVFAVLVPFALYNFTRATKSQEGGV